LIPLSLSSGFTIEADYCPPERSYSISEERFIRIAKAFELTVDELATLQDWSRGRPADSRKAK
jgi:hypothetical protein